MMRRGPLLALVASVAATGGCTDLLVRGCPLEAASSSNPYELSHELVVPADCPVPIASIGELKFAGATLYDDGVANFDFAAVTVTNADGQFKNANVTPFEGTRGVSWRASPLAVYPAATANFGLHDGSIRPDFGAFDVRGSGSGAHLYGQIRITYRPAPMNVSLSGPEISPANSLATWTVSAVDGSAPYDFHWYRNGTLVGTGSSFGTNVGTADFVLRIEVTDQTWSTVAEVRTIDVDGVRVALAGPTLVYASSGGGTWEADGLGGTLPYTFEWYVEDEWVGAGPSWSGYPGDEVRLLNVRMRDAAGATHTAALPVRGIGGGGGCSPVPPALTC